MGMIMIRRICNVLKMSLKSLATIVYSLRSTPEKKRRCFNLKYINHTSLAMSCGAYPASYPRYYPSPKYFITKLITGKFFLRYLSWGGIGRKLEKNNSIYIKTDELDYFGRVVLPRIERPFVLVTGGSDYSNSEFRSILNNEYLIHWFSQNNVLISEKVSSIPIGLDFNRLFIEDAFGEKKTSPKEQERKLEKIKKIKVKKSMKVFTNFHLSYTSNRRKELYKLLKNNPCIYFQKMKIPRTDMWNLQKGFVFNFSPVGNGLDCVRTWEALVLGQIPIVERTNSPLDKLYEQFPIVIIDDISEINEKNLKKWYKKYSKMFNADMERKLTNGYWIDLIRSKCN